MALGAEESAAAEGLPGSGLAGRYASTGALVAATAAGAAAERAGGVDSVDSGRFPKSTLPFGEPGWKVKDLAASDETGREASNSARAVADRGAPSFDANETASGAGGAAEAACMAHRANPSAQPIRWVFIVSE
jgi:hypothetical protein